MATSKKAEFPSKDVDLSHFAKALSHPARIAILKTLAAKKECICGDLVLDLPLAQSTVSQHLRALKDAGLIKGEIDGPRSRYCIDKKNFERLKKLLDDFNSRVLKTLIANKC